MFLDTIYIRTFGNLIDAVDIIGIVNAGGVFNKYYETLIINNEHNIILSCPTKF